MIQFLKNSSGGDKPGAEGEGKVTPEEEQAYLKVKFRGRSPKAG